jgi:SAM-dependent methyltransferase
MNTPLFELSPTTRFADRASDYALFRPSYPTAAVDFALAGLGALESLVAADIGAGTGIASRLLADRGVRVLAVEPNAAMREGAEAHPGVTFIDGAAEATGLGTASVDFVLCAQAFHWFRPAEALREFWRILKPTGWLILFVNERDDRDPLTRGYDAAIQAAADCELSLGMRERVDEALETDGRAVAPASFPHTQDLSREGLIGRACSASYVPKEGPRHDQLLLDLDALWSAHRTADGLVTLSYRTFVWRVARPAHSA